MQVTPGMPAHSWQHVHPISSSVAGAQVGGVMWRWGRTPGWERRGGLDGGGWRDLRPWGMVWPGEAMCVLVIVLVVRESG